MLDSFRLSAAYELVLIGIWLLFCRSQTWSTTSWCTTSNWERRTSFPKIGWTLSLFPFVSWAKLDEETVWVMWVAIMWDIEEIFLRRGIVMNYSPSGHGSMGLTLLLSRLVSHCKMHDIAKCAYGKSFPHVSIWPCSWNVLLFFMWVQTCPKIG